MFIRRNCDDLQRFLEWRRQTRFVRHYGGPILALTFFAACVWYVWQAAQHAPRPDAKERQLSKQLWQDVPNPAPRTSFKP